MLKLIQEQVVTIKTANRVEFQDITATVKEFVRQMEAEAGSVLLFVPHTTAAVTVNEGADPYVLTDLTDQLEKMVPRVGGYRHAEGNSDAHIKASLMGSSLHLPVKDGKILLGFWQAIYFAEFDGPRERRFYMQLIT